MANLIFISGNLGMDAKTAQAGQMPITSLSVGVSENTKGKDGKWTSVTDWFSVKAFGKIAEATAKFSKGDEVEVTGKLKTSSYKNKDGQTVKITEIIASSVMRKKKANAAPQPQQQQYYSNTQNLQPQELEPQDGDMPF